MLPAVDATDTNMAAPDDHAKLMCWPYCLGHLSFFKLKELVTNSKIPKKFEKVVPPKCAGCFFDVMTKLPWRSNENKSSLVATKPGGTVSVDQMVSTEAGFLPN